MACGCPVVSTDCPSGPAEILDEDRYGRLVAVGDGEALSRAIIELLDHPTDAAVLRERAAEYSSEASAEQHERVLETGDPSGSSAVTASAPAGR
jgi:glycosyltransferase involved in cell wall biosynthesis